MSLHWGQYAIEMLERRSEYLTSITDYRTFLLELDPFLDLLANDSRFKPYIQELNEDQARIEQDFLDACGSRAERVSILKEQFLRKFPDLIEREPRVIEGDEPPPDSLATFDLLAKKRLYKFEKEPSADIYAEDPTYCARMISILTEKTKHREAGGIALIRSLRDLEAEQRRVWREHVHRTTVHAGCSYWALSMLRAEINPERPFPFGEAYGTQRFFARRLLFGVNAQDRKTIEDMIYHGMRPGGKRQGEGFIDQHPINHPLIERFKDQVRRLYVTVRDRLDVTLGHHQLLSRYKTLCEVYQPDAVRALASKAKGKAEQHLKEHMAGFLFQNGVSPIYEFRWAKEMMDVFDANEKNPLLIEAKQYTQSVSPAQIKRWVGELFSYASRLSGRFPVRRGFLLIYRLRGPTLALPEEISMKDYSIFPILIDVAPIAERGSRAPAPIKLTAEDLHN